MDTPVERPVKSTFTGPTSDRKLNFWRDGFMEYLQSGAFSDIILQDERGKEYKCHKVILCRKSDYFSTLLAGGFRESGQTLVQIADVDQVLDEVLRFLYTGSISVTRDNVSALLNAAEAYMIEALTTFVLENVQVQFEKDKDLVFAYYNRGDQSRLAIADFIKSDFEAMVAQKCFSRLSSSIMGPDALCEILSSNDLVTETEDAVCDVIEQYLDFNQNLELQDKEKLFRTVRWNFVSLPTCMRVYGKFSSFCPIELSHSMVFRACANEGVAPPASLSLQKPRGSFATFNCRPKSTNDNHGLFYWMGRGKISVGTKWKNAVEANLVAISSSSNWNGTPLNPQCVGTGISTPPHAAIFWCDHGIGQWVQFDINPSNINNFRLKPTHYAYGYSTTSWLPRNWVFEAGNVGEPWTVLRNHADDQSFMANAVIVFACDPLPEDCKGFTLFRIRNTGVDSSGSNWLGLSSLELFGETVIL